MSELFGAGKIYDVRRLPIHDCLIHAPCAIHNITEDNTSATFTVDGWGAAQGPGNYYILLSGWAGPTPNVTILHTGQGPDPVSNDKSIHRAFVAGGELMIIHLEGPAKIQITKRLQ